MTHYRSNWLKESWKRWLAWLVLASIFAVACVFLSNWQFSRRQEAVNRNELIAANYDQKAVPLDSLAKIDSFDSKDEWRPVTIEGSFIPEKSVLVRNRPLNGQPGFLLVIPFLTDQGRIVAVDSGWLPTGSKQDSPDDIPLPDSSHRTLHGRVRAAEPSLDREAPAGQIGTVNIDLLLEKQSFDQPVYRKLYIRASEGLNAGQVFPKVLSKPELTEGNHLSYALQWILFALMAFFALTWAVRQELRAKHMAADPNYKPVTKKRIGDDDKAVEDALLG